MSFNVDFYNRCQKCKHLKESVYMKLENGETLYNYYCGLSVSIGEVKCSKFEEKNAIQTSSRAQKRTKAKSSIKSSQENANERTSCINADIQKEVFDNLCKDELDKKLQAKFGEYADIICNTKATKDGGETYLSIGLYDVADAVINFSDKLSIELALSNEDTNILLEKYIDIFNLSLDIDYDECLDKKEIVIYTESPYIDEFTEQEVLDIINYSISISIDKKIVGYIKSFMDEFLNDANKTFGYRWQEYVLSNPEF